MVNNIETLAAVPWIVPNGGDSYARLGVPGEPGTKLVCLNERFARPGVYEVEFGVPVRWIVDELGGGLRPGHTLRAIQIGGPLGGFLGPDDLDVSLTSRALAELGVSLGHGSLVAIDDRIGARDLLRHVWEFAAAESCGACTPCRVGTRRGLDYTTQADSGAARFDPLLDVMATGSMCAFGTGVAGAVRSLLRVYAGEVG